MPILLGQQLDIDSRDNILLTNTMNNDILLHDNYERRKDVGKAVGANLKPVCSLDVTFLQNEPTGLGKYVLEARSGTEEFRYALNRFLEKYPEFRVSDVRIK